MCPRRRPHSCCGAVGKRNRDGRLLTYDGKPERCLLHMAGDCLALPRLVILYMNQALTALTEINLDDLTASVGAQDRPRLASALRRVFHAPALKFAHQMLDFDRAAGDGNLPGAARRALRSYVRDVRLFGRENLPASAPVIVLANHPGLSDTLCLFAAINRADLRIIAMDRPFLRALPNVSDRLFYVGAEAAHRMGAVRRTSAHLRAGGSVMTFPAGEIEPDPAVYEGALESLSTWTDSAGVFLRFEPRAVIVPALVRNVVWKSAARHPLTWLRKTRAERERFAAALQLTAHLLFEVRPVVVSVQFAAPVTLEEVGSVALDAIHTKVLERMRGLIENPPQGEGESAL